MLDEDVPQSHVSQYLVTSRWKLRCVRIVNKFNGSVHIAHSYGVVLVLPRIHPYALNVTINTIILVVCQFEGIVEICQAGGSCVGKRSCRCWKKGIQRGCCFWYVVELVYTSFYTPDIYLPVQTADIGKGG